MEYLGASLMEVDANILNGTIAQAVYDRRRGVLPGLSKQDLFRVSESILPFYQSLVVSGMRPFVLKDGDTYDIVYSIMDKTGYGRNTVIMYLATLQELAAEGAINSVHYNPQLPSDIITTKSVGEKLFTDPLFSGLEKRAGQIFGMVVVLGIGYLVIKSGIFNKRAPRRA